MAVNKVVYAGSTLIDLTGITVTPSTLARGVTAIAADGSLITGEMDQMSLLDVYPVGSIYMSVNNTNPGTLFGGTWVQWGAGRVPLGVDANDTDFATVENTGGEKTHVLTADEMAAHTHGSKTLSGQLRVLAWGGGSTSGIVTRGSGSDGRTASGGNDFGQYYFNINATHEHSSVGGDEAHNNLQPYITCYMWKRTA